VLIAGAIVYEIECLFNKNVMKNLITKAFKNTYVNLASVALAVIFGFIADGMAFGFLFIYFILWSFFAEKPKKKLT
jgi:hypothetical protein